MFCVISLKVSAKKKCLRDSEKIAGVGEKEEILYTNWSRQYSIMLQYGQNLGYLFLLDLSLIKI